MCDELEKMIQEGRDIAELLVKHFENAGAVKMDVPIETDSGCYRVTVIRTL